MSEHRDALPPSDDKPHAYTPDQQRVADYIVERSGNNMGGGDDPIGFLMASHTYLGSKLEELSTARSAGVSILPVDDVLIAKAKLAQECGGSDASVTVVIKARDILAASTHSATAALTPAEFASVARFLRIAARREQDETGKWLGHQQKQVDLAIKIEGMNAADRSSAK